MNISQVLKNDKEYINDSPRLIPDHKESHDTQSLSQSLTQSECENEKENDAETNSWTMRDASKPWSKKEWPPYTVPVPNRNGQKLSIAWDYAGLLPFGVIKVYNKDGTITFTGQYSSEQKAASKRIFRKKKKVLKAFCKLCAQHPEAPFHKSLMSSVSAGNIKQHLRRAHEDNFELQKLLVEDNNKRIAISSPSNSSKRFKLERKSTSQTSITEYVRVKTSTQAESFRKNISKYEWDLLKDRMLDVIISPKHSMPLDVFSEGPLLDLMRVFVPQCPAFGRESVITRMNERMLMMKDDMAIIISKLYIFYNSQPFATLHHDVVTDKCRELGLLGISINFRDAKLERYEVSLGLVSLESHRARAVANSVKERLEEFGISVTKHVREVTSDTAAAARAVARVLERDRLDRVKGDILRDMGYASEDIGEVGPEEDFSDNEFAEYLQETTDRAILGRDDVKQEDCTFHLINKSVECAVGMIEHTTRKEFNKWDGFEAAFSEGKEFADLLEATYSSFISHGSTPDFSKYISTRPMALLDVIRAAILNSKACKKVVVEDWCDNTEIFKKLTSDSVIDKLLEVEAILSSLSHWYKICQSKQKVTKSYEYILWTNAQERMEGKAEFDIIRKEDLCHLSTNACNRTSCFNRKKVSLESMSSFAKRVCKRMSKELRDRFSTPSDSTLLAMSLDIRTKHLRFLPDDLKHKAESLRKAAYLKMKAIDVVREEGTDDVRCEDVPDDMVVLTDFSTQSSNNAMAELEQYLKDNPRLEYWSGVSDNENEQKNKDGKKKKKKKTVSLVSLFNCYEANDHAKELTRKMHPNMYKLYAMVVTAVSSNAFQERIFSRLKLTSTHLRPNLSVENSSMLIALRNSTQMRHLRDNIEIASSL